MTALPSSLALGTISGQVAASPHNSNNSAVQTAVNSLITALSGGSAGQVLQALGTSSVGWLTPPSARAYHSANQSLPNGVATVLAFNSERFDTDTIHDTATNNSRLTCRTAGKYLIGTHVRIAVAAGGLRAAWLRLNGLTDIAYQQQPPIGSAADILGVSTLYDLAVNDYVETVCYQNSGGAINAETAGNFTPEFWMVRVG